LNDLKKELELAFIIDRSVQYGCSSCLQILIKNAGLVVVSGDINHKI